MLESYRKEMRDRLQIQINRLRAERTKVNSLLNEIRPYANSTGAHYMHEAVDSCTDLLDNLERVKGNF